ncbi:hypothetical protein F0562_001405 [Nyssa sinensis]|uniref:Uncharacterized protein n=1 Tax=Nyssa sinensis TaxID=561372 RepID=A0A5J5C6S2_9ASTE|nr:hypothetical protein F0562_001405 [Nyssa sinensis]
MRKISWQKGDDDVELLVRSVSGRGAHTRMVFSAARPKYALHPPEIFTHPEVPNLHLISDEERAEVYRQMKEMDVRLEQLKRANDILRFKVKLPQFKEDVARAKARPEWETWALDLTFD